MATKKQFSLRSTTKKASESAEKGDIFHSTLQTGSETAFSFHCDLCYKEDNYIEATGYCTNCKDYLCQECYRTHLRPKPSQHHVLLDKYKMPKDASQGQSKDICTEQCTVHKHKTLKYYCAEHNVFGCSVCVTLYHRNCEDVDYIPDIAEDVLRSREYIDMITRMKHLTKATQQAINSTQTKTYKTNQQHSDASGFFKQLRKDLNAAVDKLETLFMKNARSICDGNLRKMKSVEDQYKQLLKDIGVLDSKFSSLENKSQFCQIFFSMKRSQDEIAALEASLLHVQDQSNITEYSLKLIDGLQKLIQQPENMATLEYIQNPQNPTHQSTQDVFSSQSTTRQNLQSGHSNPKAKHTKTFAVRKTLEQKYTTVVHIADIGVSVDEYHKDSWITGSVFLSGEKLVAVDCVHATINLINLQSNTISSHLEFDHELSEFHSWLWDITAVTNPLVAVTSPEDSAILFINVTRTLTLDHRVKVNGKCLGITCISDKFVITYENPAKVEIISSTGKLLKTVVSIDRGKQLFDSPRHVAVSPDQQTIYISDVGRYTVTSLDLSGHVKAIFKDDELLVDPRGLTVDKAGVLYVCGGAASVFQLTTDLHKIRVLLKDSNGIPYPESVSYNEKQNLIYIGMLFKNIIKVFQLC